MRRQTQEISKSKRKVDSPKNKFMLSLIRRYINENFVKLFPITFANDQKDLLGAFISSRSAARKYVIPLRLKTLEGTKTLRVNKHTKYRTISCNVKFIQYFKFDLKKLFEHY